jgi:hypothetical protein
MGVQSRAPHGNAQLSRNHSHNAAAHTTLAWQANQVGKLSRFVIKSVLHRC